MALDTAKLNAASILMLDDEVASTCLMQNFLNRVGYANVESINDPTIIFDSIERVRPDLILLDLTMPNIDGFQVMEMLRKSDGPAARVPIVVITGHGSAANKRRAFAAGATDLLIKPIDPSEANMRLRNVLQSHFLQLEIEEQNRLLEQRVADRTAQLQNALDGLQAAQRQMLQQGRLNAFAEMAAGVVHDFSNTLMAIIGYSEMLLGADGRLLADKEMALDYLRIINTAGRDAAEVVSRLREFYRPRENVDSFQSVDLNEVVQQAVSLSQPKWRARGVRVQTEMEKVPAINGNGAALRELLTNLIFNAVDASADNSSVELRTSRTANAVAIEVEDHGCGMTPEVRARCLEPFYSTKGDHGTGLGLPMVFGIVKRHQGTLEIESEVGRGTTMRIALPITTPPAMEPADETLALAAVA